MDEETRLTIAALSEEVRLLRIQLHRNQTERTVLALATTVLVADHANADDDPDALLAFYRGAFEMFAARTVAPQDVPAEAFRRDITQRIEIMLSDAEGLLHHMRCAGLYPRPPI